jgi:hypothetical protein
MAPSRSATASSRPVAGVPRPGAAVKKSAAAAGLSSQDATTKATEEETSAAAGGRVKSAAAGGGGASGGVTGTRTGLSLLEPDTGFLYEGIFLFALVLSTFLTIMYRTYRTVPYRYDNEADFEAVPQDKSRPSH